MTFNTGNPIGSTDARDRSDNSEFLDEVVNSLDLTKPDRFGRTRDTLEGIYQKSAYYRAGTFDAGYTLTNNRQTLAYGNSEYSWSGSFGEDGKQVPSSSTPETTGGIGAGAWVDRTQETLRSELSWAISQYHLVNYNDINAILLVTTGPITIHAPIGRWASPNTWRDGVTLLGERMPWRSADGTRLEGGTVFEGECYIIAKHQGTIKNCGFDSGSYVVGLGKPVANGLMITNTPTDGLDSTQPPILGWDVDMVSGLVRAAGDTFHGVLVEGMSDSVVGTLVGYNGIASVVVKNRNSVCGNLIGYDGTPYAVVIKSNKYAPVENLQVGKVKATGGGGFRIVSDDPTAVGAGLASLTIDDVNISGGTGGFKVTSTSAQPVDNVTIGNLTVIGVAGLGVEFDTPGVSRFKIGKHHIYGCTHGVSVQSEADVDLGDGESTGNTNFGYIVDSSKAKAGHISTSFNGAGATYLTTRYFNVDSYTCAEATVKGGNYLPNGSSITPFLTGISSSSGTISDSEPIYHRRYAQGVVAIAGKITRTCSVNDILLTLPVDITPVYAQVGTVNVWDGTSFTSQNVSIDTGGGVRSMFALAGGGSYINFTPLEFKCL